MRVWWGGENAWKAGDWAHASSFLQTHRMRSAQPSTSLFIPAHAGNTDCYLHRMGAPEAHPRAYGEYVVSRWLRVGALGSSPCIRGIRCSDVEVSASGRLIPVHTGNTSTWRVKDFPYPAHPRAYGEYRGASGFLRYSPGSSPCIRGIREERFQCFGSGRLIPVHTGNTPRPLPKSSLTPAHPRAYGEYSVQEGFEGDGIGSSPCIRGIPTGGGGNTARPRLIPVHTGNTAKSQR